jgi:outer membrane protein W
MKHKAFFACAIVAMIPAAPAAAQDNEQNGFVRIGVTRVRLVDQGSIFVNGTRDPAADYKTPTIYVAAGTIGYFVHPKFAVEVSGTTPGSTSNTPAGDLTGVPNLGWDRFSIFTATATFHPLRGGTVSPYIGGGVAWQKVWSTRDGFATNLRVHDATGPVIQGGFEVSPGRGFGLFAEAKKAFYSADASGDLGPAHVTARAKLDPLLLQAGAFIRF